MLFMENRIASNMYSVNIYCTDEHVRFKMLFVHLKKHIIAIKRQKNVQY